MESIEVAFHNPSVRDFMQYRLTHQHDDVADLIAAGMFLDQYVQLFQGSGGRPYPQILRDPDAFVSGVTHVITGDTIHLPANNDVAAVSFGSIGSHKESLESRALFAFDISRVLGTESSEKLQKESFEYLYQHLGSGGQANIRHAAIFLQRVYGVGRRSIAEDRVLIDALIQAIIHQISWDTDVRLLTELFDNMPQLFLRSHIVAARTAIRQCARFFAEGDFRPESPDLYFEAARILREAAKRLKVNIEGLIEIIEERGRDAEEEYAYEEEPEEEPTLGAWIDGGELFKRLEGEISSRDSEGA